MVFLLLFLVFFGYFVLFDTFLGARFGTSLVLFGTFGLFFGTFRLFFIHVGTHADSY